MQQDLSTLNHLVRFGVSPQVWDDQLQHFAREQKQVRLDDADRRRQVDASIPEHARLLIMDVGGRQNFSDIEDRDPVLYDFLKSSMFNGSDSFRYGATFRQRLGFSNDDPRVVEWNVQEEPLRVLNPWNYHFAIVTGGAAMPSECDDVNSPNQKWLSRLLKDNKTRDKLLTCPKDELFKNLISEDERI